MRTTGRAPTSSCRTIQSRVLSERVDLSNLCRYRRVDCLLFLLSPLFLQLAIAPSVRPAFSGSSKHLVSWPPKPLSGPFLDYKHHLRQPSSSTVAHSSSSSSGAGYPGPPPVLQPRELLAALRRLLHPERPGATATGASRQLVQGADSTHPSLHPRLTIWRCLAHSLARRCSAPAPCHLAARLVAAFQTHPQPASRSAAPPTSTLQPLLP